MKKFISVSTIAAALVLGSLSLQAKSGDLQLHVNQSQVKSASQSAVNKEIAFQKAAIKLASKEIMKGLQKTIQAIDALGKEKTKDAQAALEEATKSFESALKVEPALKLVPVETNIQLYSIDVPLKTIDKAVNIAISLLKDHEVQTATAILEPLKDEIDIDTMYIPMDLYPVATQTALKALKKGDKKAALAALVTAMDTMVHTRVVMPLGLLTAQDLVTAASRLDKSKKKEVLALLDAASEELAKARELGYVKKHSAEYASLERQIKALKKEVKGKNIVAKLYEKLKKDFESLVHKTRNDTITIGSPAQQKAEEKVMEFEKKEGQRALKERQEFLKEAQQDKSKTVK